MRDLAELFGKSKAQPEGRGRAILTNNSAKSKHRKIETMAKSNYRVFAIDTLQTGYFMNEKLQHYHKKRNFNKTSEPKGKIEHSATPVFVVQKHDATTLHYDFRIEIDGVLKSWAVPKGPSKDPHDKRLAIPTEDHPMEYKDFSGTIPEGEYGAGTVEIWDHGTYENLKDNISMQKAFNNGKIEIKLHGKKLHGNYALFEMKNAKTQKDKAKPWLLVKMQQ